MRLYSPSTGCTYLESIHGDQVPADAVEITDEVYIAVIAAPPPGKVRSHTENGQPILIDAPLPLPLTSEQSEAARRAAYSLESDPLFIEWQYDQTAEAEQAWRDKVAEIKARFPLPAE